MGAADLGPIDNGPVPAGIVAEVLTAGDFVFDDASTQSFRLDGATTYVEGGRPTEGTWHVDDSGSFCSSWPPSYTGCYDLRWLVERGEVAGVRFVELRTGREFVGRYLDKAD